MTLLSLKDILKWLHRKGYSCLVGWSCPTVDIHPPSILACCLSSQFLFNFYSCMYKHISAIFMSTHVCAVFFSASLLALQHSYTQHSLHFSPDLYRFLFIPLGPSWEWCAYQIIQRPTSWISNFSCWYIKPYFSLKFTPIKSLFYSNLASE